MQNDRARVKKQPVISSQHETEGYKLIATKLEIASSLTLLAMTEGVSLALFCCHCERRRGKPWKNQTLNTKSEILNNVKERSAVSNQQSVVSG